MLVDMANNMLFGNITFDLQTKGRMVASFTASTFNGIARIIVSQLASQLADSYQRVWLLQDLFSFTEQKSNKTFGHTVSEVSVTAESRPCQNYVELRD